MTCFKPNTVWYGKERTKTGKRKIVFDVGKAHQPDAPFQIACRQCIGCRLKRSRDRALRCKHESSLYSTNCFITLTFNDESLYARPNPHSLDVRDVQLFMKRLRKRHVGNTEIEVEVVNEQGELVKEYRRPIRQYHCGEYGDKFLRPHYHICIFNWTPPDLVYYRKSPTGQLYFTSDILSGPDNPNPLWPHGFAVVGALTYESAAYVARYVTKKQTGDNAFKKYTRIDPETGEILAELRPEYNTGSTRPGIGKWWYDKFGATDIHAHDLASHDGKVQSVPEYYDRLLERFDPIRYDDIKEDRVRRARESKVDTSPEALERRNKYFSTIVKDRLKRIFDGST